MLNHVLGYGEYNNGKIVIFGYSALGKAVYHEVIELIDPQSCFFCDNDIKKISEERKPMVLSAQKAVERYPDAKYIVTGIYCSNEMEKQLISMGISKNQIFCYLPTKYCLDLLQQQQDSIQELTKQFDMLKKMVLSIEYRHSIMHDTVKRCNLCTMDSIHFLPTGVHSKIFQHLHIIGGGYRENAVCPFCGAGDRERLVYYVLQKYTGIFQDKCKILHIAPEVQLKKKILLNKDAEYFTGDIRPGVADYVVDVTNMQFEDRMFDYIIMNHVLEHIMDERAAISELKRCLNDKGILILSFPVTDDQGTIEDYRETTADERLKRYGQEDHVRLYGIDCKQHLESYGLKVEMYRAKDLLSENMILQMGIIPDDRIYFCR